MIWHFGQRTSNSTFKDAPVCVQHQFFNFNSMFWAVLFIINDLFFFFFFTHSNSRFAGGASIRAVAQTLLEALLTQTDVTACWANAANVNWENQVDIKTSAVDVCWWNWSCQFPGDWRVSRRWISEMIQPQQTGPPSGYASCCKPFIPAVGLLMSSSSRSAAFSCWSCFRLSDRRKTVELKAFCCRWEHRLSSRLLQETQGALNYHGWHVVNTRIRTNK